MFVDFMANTEECAREAHPSANVRPYLVQVADDLAIIFATEADPDKEVWESLMNEAKASSVSTREALTVKEVDVLLLLLCDDSSFGT